MERPGVLTPGRSCVKTQQPRTPAPKRPGLLLKKRIKMKRNCLLQVLVYPSFIKKVRGKCYKRIKYFQKQEEG